MQPVIPIGKRKSYIKSRMLREKLRCFMHPATGEQVAYRLNRRQICQFSRKIAPLYYIRYGSRPTYDLIFCWYFSLVMVIKTVQMDFPPSLPFCFPLAALHLHFACHQNHVIANKLSGDLSPLTLILTDSLTSAQWRRYTGARGAMD